MMLDTPDSFSGPYGKKLKARPLSPGPQFKKAQLDPLIGAINRTNLPGRLKKL